MNTSSKPGLGTLIRRLLELTDGELEAIYRQDHPFYTPRFTPIMKALKGGEPLTIRQIAERSGTSHSAASQTVAKMHGHGLVQLVAGDDRRSRMVTLSDDGRDLLPWLEMRWAATTRAAKALDASLSHPLSDALIEAIAALEARAFSDRIRDHET